MAPNPTTEPTPPSSPAPTSSAASISATEEELALVFATWAQRYEDDPDAYEDELGEARSYGVGAARYFVDLFEELLAGGSSAVASAP